MHRDPAGRDRQPARVVIGVVLMLALFVHALRTSPSERSHGWLVIVPLLIIAGWVFVTLTMG